jgi:antitoxin component YwqK of YwqJK toxin-antitoxin module
LQAKLKNGRFHDNYVGYHLNNKIAFNGSMRDGLKDGYWTYYYTNGSKESAGKYQNNKKVGLWKKYAKSGRVIAEDFY